jgi:hypothetical protein
MKSTVALPLLLCLAIPFAPCLAQPVQLTFALYSVGMQVAESTMSFDLEPASYAMGLRYHLTGLVKVFASDMLDQSSTGLFARDEPVPLTFNSLMKLHSHDRIVTFAYRDGSPTATATSPPNEAERDIVPVADRAHTLDPLSAMVDMLHTVARTGRCDLAHNTYDGRRLETFQVRTGGEEDLSPSDRSLFNGRALRCDYTSRPIAGFRFGDGRDEDARPHSGTIWLARLTSGGPRLPVRGLIELRILGSTTMYLTAVTP